jgi:hypothetical protein
MAETPGGFSGTEPAQGELPPHQLEIAKRHKRKAVCEDCESDEENDPNIVYPSDSYAASRSRRANS